MPRVLLVDDDKYINEVIKSALEMVGHDVRAVENAQQAAEACDSFVPDVTVVDLNLPGISGLEFLKQLAIDRPACLQILASGMADAKMLRTALDAGAFTILSKPYAISDLLGLLDWASFLKTALEAESRPPEQAVATLKITCPCASGVRAEDLSRIVAAARTCGADPAVAGRKVLIAAGELMKNAATHGALNGQLGDYVVELKRLDASLLLTVTTPGDAFDWVRAVAHARSALDKSRASGLQLVLALTDDLQYAQQGREARARFALTSGKRMR